MEVLLIVLGAIVVLFVLSLAGLIYRCPPNKVMIFSGSKRGPRLLKGGVGMRVPLLERVDALDLSNMIIDLTVTNAYAKGGVPVNVEGVANVKIAGHEPTLNNAIERFLGKDQAEIMGVAKATLEGSLRGVLATLTPEQLNEDRNRFAEEVVNEVDQDMTSLGLVVDTLKIQNITDDVEYLDSIGRIRNSELLSRSRIAEAIARADSKVRNAENLEQEVTAEVSAAIQVANADAEKELADIMTRRAAVVAEERAAVAALVARASADVEVQKARYEQVKRRLDADVIQPAKAHCKAQEQDAKAKVAPIIEDGRARSEALRNLARSWNDAGDQAREIFLLRKMEPIIDKLTDTISGAKIEKMTVIDVGGSSGMDARKMLMLAEQVKEGFGVDVVSKLQEMTATKPAQAVKVAPVIEPKQDPKPEPKQERKLMRRRSRPSDAPAVYNEPPPIAGDD